MLAHISPRTSQQTSDSGIPASPVQLKPVLGVSGSGVGLTGSGVGVTVAAAPAIVFVGERDHLQGLGVACVVASTTKKAQNDLVYA